MQLLGHLLGTGAQRPCVGADPIAELARFVSFRSLPDEAGDPGAAGRPNQESEP